MRTAAPITRLARFAARVRDRARRRAAGDGGFVLLESVIAISLITVIMSAVGAEYVSGLASSEHQRASQGAVQVADSAVELIRSLHPSDLVTGRDTDSVASQFAAAPAAVQPWLANMAQATDNSGKSAIIPTTGVTQQPGTVAYTVTDYLGWCYIPAGSGDCGKTVDGTMYLRAVVAVTWNANYCGSTGCSYITATLLSTANDPTFHLAQPLPPAPVITAPGNQTVAVNDKVDLQLLVADGTGVPAFTWVITSGTLPTGLTLSTAGEITGTVGGSAAAARSVTVQVTDAFLRTTTVTFSWTVLPPLVLADPGAQASTTLDTVNLPLPATGGTGSGYAFTDPTGSLPPGLSIGTTSGTITGTPTSVGEYHVKITVTDSSGTRTASTAFTWTVTYPPIAASNPGTQTSTVGVTITPLKLSASGGDGSYVWSPTSVPSWLSLDPSTGTLTGTPTATGSATVAVTVSDPSAGPSFTKTVSFTWNVVAKPSVTAPVDQSSKAGDSIGLQLAVSCPNAPCSYLMTNGPAGLAISASGKVTGTIGSPASTTTYHPTVTVTDADGASTTSDPFAWTVVVPLRISPGNQATLKSAAANLSLATFVSGGTAPYTYSATGLPTWLSLIASTGQLTGTAPATTGNTPGITVTVTDQAGTKLTSAAFTWYVIGTPLTLPAIGDQSTKHGNSDNLTVSAGGGVAPYSYSASGLPSWLSMNPSTGKISGTAPGSSSRGTTDNITVRVADSAGERVVSNAFSWTVT